MMKPPLFEAMTVEPYEPRGILHSEAALIITIVRLCGVRRIIESGRARGQSTYLLAKYLPDVEIHSIELRAGPDEKFGRARLAGMKNVHLYTGDGTEILPALAATLEETPAAILCDGPKGIKAIDVIECCFQSPQVRVGFIHDMRKLDHGGASPYRAAAIKRFPRHMFSDDARWIAMSSWMDAEVVKAGGPCGPQFEAEYGSYGPTLGVFFNPQQ